METAWVFINGWMNSEIVVCIYTYIIYISIHIHTHNGILFRHKKDRNLAIGDNMDGITKGNMLTEISHKEKQILYDFYFLWTLKKQKPQLIHTGTRLVVARDTRLEVRRNGWRIRLKQVNEKVKKKKLFLPYLHK